MNKLTEFHYKIKKFENISENLDIKFMQMAIFTID